MRRLLLWSLRFVVTLAMVVLAVFVGLVLWDYYLNAPWTRDGRVRADVVAIAPDVPGLVTEVLVKDNQRVRRGDVLFRIDPERFDLALRQAEAVVEAQKVTADQSERDYQRLSKLTELAASKQMVEQALARSLEAKATYDQAVAIRDTAKLNLERSEVRASVNGRITNMNLRPGAYVNVGYGVLALIDEDSLRVEGYFEETKLPHIHVGDKATIRLAGEETLLSGHVESIAGGIEDRERIAGANLLANINPTFSWVRLAQRIPVRIVFDSPSAAVDLISGRTATIRIVAPDESPRWPFDWLWRLASRKETVAMDEQQQ